MPPASSTLSVSAPPPPKPLYLSRAVIAVAAALAALLLIAAAYATWRIGSPPAALLGRPAAPSRFYSFDLVREYPHDPDAFTQVFISS
jgi:glutamine cyclotransferase